MKRPSALTVLLVPVVCASLSSTHHWAVAGDQPAQVRLQRPAVEAPLQAAFAGCRLKLPPRPLTQDGPPPETAAAGLPLAPGTAPPAPSVGRLFQTWARAGVLWLVGCTIILRLRGAPRRQRPSAAAGGGLVMAVTAGGDLIAGRTLDPAIRDHLEAQGVNVANLLRKRPGIHGYPLDRVLGSTAYLQDIGADVRRVLNACPQVLTCPVLRMRATVECLERNGIDVHRVVQRFPAIFGYSIDRLESVVEFLHTAGLDVPRVIDGFPALLGLSLERLQLTVAYLRGVGLNATKVLNSRPTIFGLRTDNLQAKVSYLRSLGIDVVKVVNAMPPLLTCDMEGTIAPKVRFLTDEMGGSAADINGFPPFLCSSLHSRIRPRYLYLKHLGSGRRSLSAILAPTDVTFARCVAGRSIEDYVTWRCSHFSPPPSRSAAGPSVPVIVGTDPPIDHILRALEPTAICHVLTLPPDPATLSVQ